MSFSPLSTLKKVWREIEEEERLSSQKQHRPVSFSSSITQPSMHRTNLSETLSTSSQHHPTRERIKNRPSLKSREPLRVLKPSTDQKRNTSWVSSTFDKLGKLVFPTEDDKKTELKEMKNFMNTMIRKRPGSENSSVLPLKRRSLSRFKNENHITNREIKRLHQKDFDLTGNNSSHDTSSLAKFASRSKKEPYLSKRSSYSNSLAESTPQSQKPEISRSFNLPSSPFENLNTNSTSKYLNESKLQKENEDLKKRVELLEQMLYKTEQKVSNLEVQLNESTIMKNESFEKIDLPLNITSDILKFSPVKSNLSKL